MNRAGWKMRRIGRGNWLTYGRNRVREMADELHAIGHEMEGYADHPPSPDRLLTRSLEISDSVRSIKRELDEAFAADLRDVSRADLVFRILGRFAHKRILDEEAGDALEAIRALQASWSRWTTAKIFAKVAVTAFHVVVNSIKEWLAAIGDRRRSGG